MATKKKRNVKSPKVNSTPKKANEETSIVKSPLFVHGVVWSVLTVFLGLFIYISPEAFLAAPIRSLLGGLFGFLTYILPLVFFGTLLYLIYFRSVKRLWQKFLLTIGAIIDIGALCSVFSERGLSEVFLSGSETISGSGFLGACVSSAVKGLIGEWGALLVFIVLLVVLLCFITKVNILPYIINGIKKLCGYSTEMVDEVKRKHDEFVTKQKAEKETEFKIEDNFGQNRLEHEELEEEPPESLRTRLKKKGIKKSDSAIDIANEFAHEIGMTEEDLGYDAEKFDLYNMKFDMDEEDLLEEKTKRVVKRKVPKPEPEDVIEDEFDAEDEYASEEVEQEKAREKNLTVEEAKNFREELDNALSNEVIEYKFPSLDLLDKSKNVTNDKRQELYKKAEQLIAVLDNFGVKAKPVQVTQGPTVTRFEIQPQSGIKLSKIVGLADDIALNLAVSTVLIAPVPGKAATVGVEIPNNNVATVTIRELLDSAEFKNAKSKLTVCLGKDIGGNVVVGDIAKWPHALIAGATGSGKSVCINSIVTSILYKADPNEVKLIMIDPKQVELGVYNGIPHLLIPVVTEAKKAAGALNWAVSEMMQRYELFKNAGVRKLEMYNKLMEKTGGEKIPQLVIIIDELADLMMVAAKEVEDYVCRLAQLARAAGIYLIIATQRPSVDVITGLIKANIPSRIAFFVSSQVDSRTIIDKAGAEKLLGRGDMLYFPTGARSTTRVQGAWVSDEEVERIVDYIKNTTPETHYREDLEDHIERISTGENGVTPDKDDDGDALLPDAIKLAIELGKISTSMVQRRLGVGYSRAGRIIDQMEARGIISPANGSKPRDVLVSHADMLFDNNDVSEDDDFEE